MSRKSMIKPYKHCKKCGALIVSGDLCEDCKPITNGDRIRKMTDEELAKILCFADCEALCPATDNEHCNGDCCGHFLRWLKQDATDINVGGKGGADNGRCN